MARTSAQVATRINSLTFWIETSALAPPRGQTKANATPAKSASKSGPRVIEAAALSLAGAFEQKAANFRTNSASASVAPGRMMRQNSVQGLLNSEHRIFLRLPTQLGCKTQMARSIARAIDIASERTSGSAHLV
jgi:hypothetical protein